MAKKLFISRALNQDSPFLELSKYDFELFGFSLLEFNVIPFLLVPHSDWYFFYSKNGVYYFFEQLSAVEKEAIKGKKIGAIGQETASACEAYLGRQIDFIADITNSDFATDFENQIQEGEHVCYVQALDSKRTLQKGLSLNSYSELVVYENKIATNIQIPETDYVCLTSSKNVQAYMSKAVRNQNVVFVSIGKSTTKTLLEYVSEDRIHMAKEPDEKSMLAEIIRLENL